MHPDNQLTRTIGEWLATDPTERDITAGAMLLLQLTGNRLQYAAITQAPARYAEMLEYQLQRHYDFRVAALTAEELEQLRQKAVTKAQDAGLDLSEESAGEDAAQAAGFGKRADHDSLPADIRALYVENLEVRRKMQQLHLRIRTKYAELTGCTASDVYAYVRELLALEERYRANWERYDRATPES